MNTIRWDEALVQKYNVKGPRYTSYPTALLLQSGFAPATARQSLLHSGPNLSLYLHIPFCRQLCFYCGCNKVISRDQTKADRYLAALATEIAFYQDATSHQTVQQLHLGGGTPTFLDAVQLRELMTLLRSAFTFHPEAALSIEVDPRSCSLEKLALLYELGFRRLSFGVQDFTDQVQQTIHRIQSYELVESLVQEARRLGFTSINLDLVYGLPHQHSTTFQQTLSQVLALDPDRVSLFSYAHLPERFAAQRKIPTESLPTASQKLALLALALETLQQAGYQAIGMDHFAKPSDPLAIAQQHGELKRNFQGYTTDTCDALLGLGVSAISQVGAHIWQHQKDLNQYYRDLSLQQHSIEKGMTLSRDDQIRAAVIASLMCNFQLDTQQFASQWQLNFAEYFQQSLAQLQSCIDDQLVEWQGERLVVTAQGRAWVRVICACFDAYLLQQHQNSSHQSYSHESYSKVV